MACDVSHVILVDQFDNELGTMEKLEAHEKGVLHRAFSIFLFNDQGEMLLQKRASEKYHCGDLWSNTCCSHPVKDVALQTCIQAKLHQEMGISAPVEKAFDFTYRAEMANGLIEHEYDHIYVGHFNGIPSPNPAEVSEWRFASMDEIGRDLCARPERYTVWFRLLFDPLSRHYAKYKCA